MWAPVRLDAAGDSIRGVWSDGQSHAMNESRPYRFSFVPGKGYYRLAPDTADYWSGGTPPRNPDSESSGPIVVEGLLPRGVVFQIDGSTHVEADEPTGPEHPGSDATGHDVSMNEYVTLAVFRPDGTTNDDVEVRLQKQGAGVLVLHLRSLTGVVTTTREIEP